MDTKPEKQSAKWFNRRERKDGRRGEGRPGSWICESLHRNRRACSQAAIKLLVALALVGLMVGVLSCRPAIAQATPSDNAPFLSAIADQTVDEDSPTIPLRVLYGDAQTPVAELRLIAASSNEKLLPSQNILFSAATAQEMVIVPSYNQSGAATVTLTVENAQGKKSSRSFRLTVKPMNDPPEITAHGSVTLLEDDTPQKIPLDVTDAESAPEALTVTVISSDPELIPTQNLTLEGTGRNRFLSLQAAPDHHGSATLILIARDPEGTEGRLELNVRVLPVNDPPILSRIPDQRLFLNQTLDSVRFSLGDDETLPAEIVVEALSSNPVLVPESGILFGGTEAKRTMSIRPAKDLTGSALITVKAHDRERLESSTSFLLTVDRENALPEIVGLANTTIDQDKAPAVLLFTVNDPDGAAELVRVEARSSNPNLVSPSNIQITGAGQDRSLTLAPTVGASGTTEITLTAIDSDGGQRRASFHLQVRPSALRPIAHSATLAFVEDAPGEIILKGESPIGQPLAYTVVSTPQKGMFSGNPPHLGYAPNANASGPDSFQFKVSDGSLESLPATVTILIQEVNDPPAITSIAPRRTDPGKSTGPIRFAIEDPETPANQLSVSAQSSDPGLVPDANILLTGRDTVREVTIMPVAGRTGTAVITVTVKDTGGLSATTAFELKVTEASGAPKGEPQFVVTPEDVPVAVSLRARDSDGQTVAFAIVDAPARGTLSGFAPNLVYRPKANESGPDRFTFKVSNTAGESAAAPVEVLIIPVNDQPMARSQAHTVNEDSILEIELGASDADKDPLTFEILSLPAKGKLSGSPPRLTYTPHANETGTDQFTFSATDGELASTTGTIRLTIDPVNDPPLASGMFVSTQEDTALSISLKGRDPDEDPLIFKIGTLPAKGLLVGTPPDLVYIPNPNASGLDRFTYTVSDGKLSSELAVATVMVVAVNDPPLAESQFLSLAEDTSVDILLGGRDADNDPLSFVIVSAPLKGSLSGSPPRLTYQSELNANGIDSFAFKVTDGTTDSPPATITLSVRPINDPPTAADQYVTMDEDSSQGIVLTGRDVESGLLTFQIVDPPRNGVVAGVPPLLTYTPARDFNGEDRLTFKVLDGDRESTAATVKISVRPVNDAPLAENQFLSVTEGRSRNVTLAGRDAEGSALQFFLTSLPTKGVLSGKPPNLIYLPHPNERGLDSFSFKVSDGILESLPGTTQFSLVEKTSGPVISKIADQTSRHGEPTAKLPFTIHDRETAAERLVLAASSSTPALVAAENIQVEGSGEARTVQVRPSSAQPGTAIITLVVWDEDGLADSAQFSLTILVENRTPVVEALSLTTPEDQPLPIQLQASDPDKDPVTLTVTSPPKKGRLSGTPPTLTYIPNANATGTDGFTFSARDASSESPAATVTIQILPVNDPPTLSKMPDQIVQAGQVIGPIRFEVIDPDTPLADLRVSVDFSSASLIRADSVFLDGSGPSRTLTLAPAAGKSGVTTVKLRVNDGELSATTEFQITILAPNQPPAISLVTPWDLAVVDPKDPLELEARADDPDGVIQRIDFYAGTTLIGSSVVPPYRFTWNTPVKGQQVLSARAIDDRGAEAASSPVSIRVDPPAGRVAVLTGGDDPDLGLIRRYLFELPVQWRLLPRTEAKVENLLHQYQAVLWHQPTGADLLLQDLDLLSVLSESATPLYFLGDSLVAARRWLSAEGRDRWQNLIHLKPGGISWLNSITILEGADHPLTKNGPVGSVARFAYPITPQQAAVQAGLPGEVVLGRSGSFDILVAAVDPKSSARTFTHHLRLGGASDAIGMAEQSRLFKNAIGWLIDKTNFVNLKVDPENTTSNAQVVIGSAPARFPKLILHRENQDTLRVQLSGAEAGANYVLEASDDLIHWSPIGVGLTGPGSWATFSSASVFRRFFRAVSTHTPTAASPGDRP